MAGSSKAFLDANLFIDIVISRSRSERVKYLISLHQDVCISTLTVANSYYVINRQDKITVKEMERYTAEFIVLDISAISLEKAYKIATDQDLEDAMQVAAAIIGGVDVFYTADARLVKNYGHLLDIQLVS